MIRNGTIHPTTYKTLLGYFILGLFLFFASGNLFLTGSGTAVLIFLHQGWQWLPARMADAVRYKEESLRKSQGILTPREAKKQIISQGIPLASLNADPQKRNEKMVGLDAQFQEGHLLVTGATRSGKGMHLTQMILSADASAMILVDPKGEQYGRTAGYRATLGPVYRLPSYTLPLSRYYDLTNSDDLTEFHFHTMTPWADKQSIFADKAKRLYEAAGIYAKHHKVDPIGLILSMAGSDPVAVLEALETVAPDAVRAFTNGSKVREMDKFAQSAWGSFDTRLMGYQQHWRTITASEREIPLDWAAQKATIYITYPFDDLKGAGPLIAAMIAGLLRYQKLQDRRDSIIVAIDELPAVGLRNIDQYLATVGGYRINLVLYIQSYSQLVEIYGQNSAKSILSNCQQQVWYPPADVETGEIISQIYGKKWELTAGYSLGTRDKRFTPDFGTKEQSQSLSMRQVPIYTANEMMALDKERVIVRLDRRYVLQAYRLWPVPQLPQLPPPVVTIHAQRGGNPPKLWDKQETK